MQFLSVWISPIQEKQNQNKTKRKNNMKNSTPIYFNPFVGSPANFIIMDFRKHIF